jgi:molybdopterin-guanine dinucleotide biosynthesis protein B
MMARDMVAVYLPAEPGMTPASLLSRFYAHLDIVLIEGWISGPYGKIEVWRRETGRPPLFPDVEGVLGLVTDDAPEPAITALARERNLRRFGRGAVKEIAAFVSSLPPLPSLHP